MLVRSSCLSEMKGVQKVSERAVCARQNAAVRATSDSTHRQIWTHSAMDMGGRAQSFPRAKLKLKRNQPARICVYVHHAVCGYIKLERGWDGGTRGGEDSWKSFFQDTETRGTPGLRARRPGTGRPAGP